jgi:Flp pilus assembly protein TadD
LVAVLFGWHPLRVESVAFVAERKDVLSGFFGLLALIAYVRYAQDRMQNAECRMQNAAAANAPHAPRSTLYLLSLLLFALGLLSKPILVTWPCVMLLLDYWPLGRMHNAECRMQKAAAAKSLHAARSPLHAPRSSLLALLVEKVPFFVLAAVMSLVTFVVQKHAGSLEVGQNFTLGARVGNALISYCRYLGKMFWPTNLSVCYPHPGHWPLGKVLLAGGLILAISVWFWIQRRRAPYLLMGWLWFCGTLAPVSQVLQTGAHAMADRYSYIPSLGVLILTVWGACELTRRWRLPVRALSVAAGGAILLCSTVTRHQIGYWRDSETLLRHALAVTENNGLAHRNLAGALYEKGQIEEAISHFREFVRLRPELANSHYNLGVALCRAGQFEEAIPQLQEAIRLEPDEADAHYNLGTACFQRGRTGEAIWQFQETIRLEPGHAQAHNNLGTALGLKGQTDEAIRQFQEALRLKPDYTEARKNLEVLLANKAHAPPPPSLVTPP